MSVAQQLVGPVRARADLRFSLHVPGGYSPVRCLPVALKPYSTKTMLLQVPYMLTPSLVGSCDHAAFNQTSAG